RLRGRGARWRCGRAGGGRVGDRAGGAPGGGGASGGGGVIDGSRRRGVGRGRCGRRGTGGAGRRRARHRLQVRPTSALRPADALRSAGNVRPRARGGTGVDDAAFGDGAAQRVLTVGARLLGREVVAALVLDHGDLSLRGGGGPSCRRSGHVRRGGARLPRCCRRGGGCGAARTGRREGVGPAGPALRGRLVGGGCGLLRGAGHRRVLVARVRRVGVVGLGGEVLDAVRCGRAAGLGGAGGCLHRAFGGPLPGGQRLLRSGGRTRRG